MDSAVLRLIFGQRIEKLTLPSGIPETVEELNLAIKKLLGITGDFSLQYLDSDFGDFFTLHSTTQIKNKATIKVVSTEQVVLNLYSEPQSEQFAESYAPDESFNHPSCSTAQSEDERSVMSDSSMQSTISQNSNHLLERKPWPMEFIVPELSITSKIMLERANEQYKQDGTVLSTPSIRSDILEKLANSIYTYTAYPSSYQVIAVAQALVKAHPCLRDPGCSSGHTAWVTRIKYKMANYLWVSRCDMQCVEAQTP